MSPQPKADESDTRTPFEKFRDATRHILTTPKSAVIKPGPTKKHAKKK
jgi:hypothetical protein